MCTHLYTPCACAANKGLYLVLLIKVYIWHGQTALSCSVTSVGHPVSLLGPDYLPEAMVTIPVGMGGCTSQRHES